MRRVLWCLLYLTALYLLPRDVYSQTRADTLHLRDAVTAWARVRTYSNNSSGLKDLATQKIAAESLYFRSKVPVTPPPPPVNQPPVAAFTLAKNDTTRLVRMTNQSSDPENGALTYRTTWGDGATSTALNPSRTYLAPGTYTVTLIATDPLGRADTATRQVTLADPVVSANSAPVADIAKSYDATTKTLAVNASASTDDKGVTGYSWSFGDGVTATGVSATRIYAASGTYTITLTVRDAEGLTATATTQQIVADPIIIPDTAAIVATPAELPRATPAFTFPAPTRSYTITSGLQAAIDTARSGDEIRLGANFTGNFIISAKACASWVTLRSVAEPPPLGARVDTLTARTFAKIATPNYEAALQTRGPVCRWRIRGVEILATHTGTGLNDLGYGIVRIGEGNDAQRTAAAAPYDMVLEQVYIHGVPLHNGTRCVVINSRNTIIRDSYISDCHARGADAQAILGWNGPGPFLIENNRLEGSGENIMFGGADPSSAELVPADITVRRNHIVKPLLWRGSQWSIKNLFELKTARRVLLERNVFENSWPASQEGMAIVIKSANAGCTSCPYVGTQDVTFRDNIVRNAAVGLNLQAADNSYGHTSFLHVARVSVTDNLFDQIGAEGRAALNLWTGDLADIQLRGNVFLHHSSVGATRGGAMILDYGGGAARRLDIRDNLMPAGAYGVFYSGGNVGTAALTSMAGTSWRFTGNTLPLGGSLASRFPAGNLFPSVVPTVDLTRFQTATQGVVVP